MTWPIGLQGHDRAQNSARCAVCEGVEGVQGVLTLFCSGAAQVVCHALRVEELSGKPPRWKRKTGTDRREEEEVESGESRIKERRP